MALAFTRLSRWLSGRHREPKISKGPSLKSSSDSGLMELDNGNFLLVNGGNESSSRRRIKRKCQSREKRKIDHEHDIVVVPSDGDCVSGSESDGLDWSVGWLEPHGPEFQSDDDSDDSFVVLVPSYGRGRVDMERNLSEKFIMHTIRNVPDIYAAAEGKKFLEQWLSSLQSG